MDTEITVALIGAAGVGGTIIGAIVGARIQANGGHAQAQAARDAAETAAQAVRRQALHDLRWTTTTALLRAAGESMEATGRLYLAAPDADTERAEAERVLHAFRLTYAEAELAAPPGIREEIEAVDQVVRTAHYLARMRAPAERAWRVLDDLCRQGNAAALHAKGALARLRATDAPLWNPSLGGGDPPPEYDEVITALNAVPQLQREQVRLLLGVAAVPLEYERRRENVINARRDWSEQDYRYQAARQKLIEAARRVLGTDGL
ncbi:hypothetical protein [Streptomyces sp. NPDC056543]|uniref:hypothetical protein n=1 Tax=unclassified Streptomyces TaxID=2593676 RepID=UPI0036877F15